MPSLDAHDPTQYVKGLLLGDPKAGKTGSLTSLVDAGYKLRIYDFDNLLGVLVNFVRKTCPDKIGNAAVQTFTDKLKGSDTPLKVAGKSVTTYPLVDGHAKAFVTALKQFSYWKTPEEDLGDPASWGAETVLVVDSLTTMALAAYRYAQSFNPAAAEPQTYYFNAQQMVMNTISLLCSAQMQTNVLVLAHIDYDKNHMGITKGFPRSIGSAINSQIGAHFNTVLLAETSGSGARTIKTKSTGIIDLANPLSVPVPDSLPLESGLATFFAAAKR